MPADPNIAIEKLLTVEGDRYVDDHHGRGPSKYGISLLTAQETHPEWTAETIRNLTPEQATAFYTQDWWTRYHLYLFDDQTLADRMLNVTVNVGPETGIKWMQRAMGFTEPEQDGKLGPNTANAANSMDPEMIWTGVQGIAGQHYQNLGPEYDSERAGLMNRVANA